MGFFFTSAKEKNARILAPQYLKQIKESAKIINETKKPEIFFSRYDLMISRIRELRELERYVKFKGDKPKYMLEQAESKRSMAIHDFIDRFYSESYLKISTLKTDSAKQKVADKFFSSLEGYFISMDKENIDRVGLLYNDLLDLTEAKK